jgi:hypothetical protein
MLFRNVGTLLPSYTVSHPTMPYLHIYYNHEDGDSRFIQNNTYLPKITRYHIPEDCIYLFTVTVKTEAVSSETSAPVYGSIRNKIL